MLVFIMFIHYYLKHRRQYSTLEAENAQYFDNPDYAIASGASRQPEVQTTKEYFMWKQQILYVKEYIICN